jgi:hypothetical protein
MMETCLAMQKTLLLDSHSARVSEYMPLRETEISPENTVRCEVPEED